MRGSFNTLHRWVGLTGVAIFIASGISMRLSHVEHIPEGAALHFIFRSRHIYLLFSALLNIAVGLAPSLPESGRGSRIGIIGSALIIVSPVLMALGFFMGPLMTQHENELSRFGVYAAALGMLLYGLATWSRATRHQSL